MFEDVSALNEWQRKFTPKLFNFEEMALQNIMHGNKELVQMSLVCENVRERGHNFGGGL